VLIWAQIPPRGNASSAPWSAAIDTTASVTIVTAIVPRAAASAADSAT
jgi:hypothetical protein